MVRKPLKEFMEGNPYWGIFKWHPLNLALKQRKRKSGSEECESAQQESLKQSV